VLLFSFEWLKVNSCREQGRTVMACRGSWFLSASCQLVPALFLLMYRCVATHMCARFLPATWFWLGRLLLTRPCLLANVCLLLVWCTVACALSRCRPLPVLPGVAHPPSAPSGVPRPKPLWGKAWSPICFLFPFRFVTVLSKGVYTYVTVAVVN
jgi:hypothetical protein